MERTMHFLLMESDISIRIECWKDNHPLWGHCVFKQHVLETWLSRRRRFTMETISNAFDWLTDAIYSKLRGTWKKIILRSIFMTLCTKIQVMFSSCIFIRETFFNCKILGLSDCLGYTLIYLYFLAFTSLSRIARPFWIQCI